MIIYLVHFWLAPQILSMKKIKVALFGSYYRGYEVLKSLLAYQKLHKSIEIVGVATDDPSNSFISPQKRVWQYPHTKKEENMVRILAESNNINVYTERVKIDEFYQKFKQWNPDICYMATFGQLINGRLFSYPKMGFYNLHPSSDDSWPSYVGGNPFKAMIDDHRKYVVITLHEVNEKFDDGKFIDRTKKIHIPKHPTVTGMHKLTSPYAAKLVMKHLEGKLKK